MHSRKNTPLFTAIATITGALIAHGAMAEAVLEEVIVTAQKRQQSLQDAPIAITAFGEADIDARGIRDVHDLALFAPNVQIAPAPGGSTGATIAIRGATTINPAITWEPTVGLYLDGVFLGKNLGGIFDIAELQRVEILRGPQGTLYGKNTLGGAVNLITREPGEEFSARLEASAGNEGYTALKARIDSGALGQVGEGLGELKLSLSYSDRQRDGFYDNVDADPTGGFNPFVNSRSSDTFSDLDSQALRLDALLHVTDNFSARYSYDQSKRDQAPTMGQLTDVNQFLFDISNLGFLGELQGLYVTPEDQRADAISNDQSNYEKSDVSGHALTLTWQVGDLTFKSLTASRETQWDDHLDLDGTPMNLFTSQRHIDYEQFSQEFQLLGGNDQLNYVAGVYYFAEKGDMVNPIQFFGLFGAPADVNEYGLDNTSYAAYGQVEWHPEQMADLTVTAGLRYTNEDKDQYIYHPNTSSGGVGSFDLTASDSWSNTTGTLIVGYDINDSANVYAKVAQGWKAGGFNGEAPDAASFLDSYDPEEVLSYELGLKSRFMDGRLQVNAAAFMNDISDMQFSVFLEGSGGAASTVANAGAATVTGFELEVAAQLTESLRIGANYGYLNTEYDEFIELGQNVKDQKDFPYAPKNTASVDLDWQVLKADWGTVQAHIDWSHKDDYVPYTNKDQNLTSTIAAYEVVNARVSIEDIQLGNDMQLRVSAWGKNIFDEEYRENTIPFGFWTVSYWGQPATYGVDLRVDF